MITKVDLNNEGFAAGSKTVALDWNDWKDFVILRPSTKLLRNNTCGVLLAFWLTVMRNILPNLR